MAHLRVAKARRVTSVSWDCIVSESFSFCLSFWLVPFCFSLVPKLSSSINAMMEEPKVLTKDSTIRTNLPSAFSASLKDASATSTMPTKDLKMH
jgi:hypothetical protein